MPTFTTTLDAREEIAEGTMAFHLRKPSGFDFKPGQAIDVILPLRASAPEDQSTRHTFSIVSAPFQDDLVIATRMCDSAYKRALESMAVGSQVAIDGPSGSLGLHKNPTRTHDGIARTPQAMSELLAMIPAVFGRLIAIERVLAATSGGFLQLVFGYRGPLVARDRSTQLDRQRLANEHSALRLHPLIQSQVILVGQWPLSRATGASVRADGRSPNTIGSSSRQWRYALSACARLPPAR